MKDCLTCKYEPDWSQWKEYFGITCCEGYCGFESTRLAKSKIPACYQLPRAIIITRFDDDSGIYLNCPAWEPKNV